MPEQKYWFDWAQFLHRLGLRETAAAFLEAAGPMNILLAQAIHFGEPFLRWAIPGGQWGQVAEVLENREECRTLIAFLRSEELP